MSITTNGEISLRDEARTTRFAFASFFGSCGTVPTSSANLVMLMPKRTCLIPG
jgi:hypothetical protein